MNQAMKRPIDESITRERLWTVNETAAYLSMSRAWVYRQVERGQLPYLKLGAFVRFQPDAVKAYASGRASEAAGGGKIVRIASRRRGGR